MDDFQRTKETRLCLWSGKKKGKFQFFEAGLWEVRGGEAVGGGLSGGPAEAPTPHLSSFGLWSCRPRKTQTCTDAAQAKYWKEKRLRHFVQTTENKSNKLQVQMRLSWWREHNFSKPIKESSNTSSKNLAVYCGVTFMTRISSSQLILL